MNKPEKLVTLLKEYKNGMTPEEIAFEMKFSTVGSVSSAISRARKVCPKGKTIKCVKHFRTDISRTGYKSYYKTYYKLVSKGE